MKKAFLQRGMDYLAAQKLEFLKQVVGTEIEQAAITYAIDQSWILPIEPLDAVHVDKLFPSADLYNVARRIDHDVTSDAEGSRIIRDAVRKDAAAHLAGIKAIAAKMGEKLTHAKPPQGDGDVTITGIPQPMTKNTTAIYGFRIDGKDVYMDMEMASAMSEYVDKKQPVTIKAQKAGWWMAIEQGS